METCKGKFLPRRAYRVRKLSLAQGRGLRHGSGKGGEVCSTLGDQTFHLKDKNLAEIGIPESEMEKDE